MKTFMTLILLFFCLNAFAVFNQPGNSNSLSNTGAMKHIDKMFIQVRNTNGSTMLDGSLVVLDVTSDNGMDVVSAGGVEELMPLCFLDQDLADDAIGRCQVFGYKSNVLMDADTNPVAGYPGYISNEHSPRVEYITPATAGAAGYHSAGVFLDAATASGTIEFFINTL